MIQKNPSIKKIQRVLETKYLKLYRQLIRKMKTHRLKSIEKQIVLDSQDSGTPSMLKISSLYNDKGDDIGKVMAFEDLTDVIQGQRAEAWKEVAKRIAHEVKNPLTPIKLSAQRLQKKFSSKVKDPAFTDCTNIIIDQTDSLKSLINEFGQFARLPEIKPHLNDLNELLKKLTPLYEQAHRSIQFKTELDKNLTPFYFDPEQLRRAVFNLIENAVHAVSKNNKAQITIKTQLDSQRELVTLNVIDNGRKLHDHEMRRMFEPYYSKRPGGSGLGLTIVKKIIADHNGYARLFHNKPQGLIVQVELPFKTT